MENKKTKLTISGSTKKPIKKLENLNKPGKRSVFIEKPQNRFSKKNDTFKTSKFENRNNFSSKSIKKNTSYNSPLGGKISLPNPNDFERRKLAEQRATKRLKGVNEEKEKKSKLGSTKREFKLTVSRAFSDEIEARERSIA